ncbi:DUF2919 domain-containing protein [Pantoea sp. Mb-10]|uniref:DUF2919 domain-containing protein n=1 Tax=unclassified Pantoea TaxID=2630326 RepID=UPI001E60E82F|nr:MULTISPECIES: DUF2919 domain-containing protein [unclassified Pantoea]MCE0489248.1 DUF2919 domain-containing protein [Pantoea sp. Mb-10]MCE0503719.1 DUF2919 domain-containing protein [Pantoea sp. Pb-8]
MTRLNYMPEDYDAKGQLRLPFFFWLILVLQARTWLLLVMAGASRQQGSDLLALFYPDAHAFWLGLALGVPAAAGLLLTGYRQRWPRLWSGWRYVLGVSFLVSVIAQAIDVSGDESATSPLPLLLMLFDGLALWALLTHRRLRDCFLPASASLV